MSQEKWINKKGFTFVETLVSIGLLGFLSVGILAVFVNNMNFGEQEKNRTNSFYLLEDTIERIYRVDIRQIENFISSGKFNHDYGTMNQFENFKIEVLPGYITTNEPNSNMPTYLITAQVRWKYKGVESDVLKRTITKTEIGGR
jgi:type II secretory pathway pseudopilin PulG